MAPDTRYPLEGIVHLLRVAHESILFVDGEDVVRGELVHDPREGWIAQVDWSTQDVWEAYPPAVAAR